MTIIDKLRREIAEAEARIRQIQKACSHPEEAITRELEATNSEGKKWRLCTCGLCETEFTRDYPKDAAIAAKAKGGADD
jgi:hypothetical protein